MDDLDLRGKCSGNFKLTIGVNVGVNGCLSLYAKAMMRMRLFQVVLEYSLMRE